MAPETAAPEAPPSEPTPEAETPAPPEPSAPKEPEATPTPETPTFQLKIPEGVSLEEAHLASIKEFASANGLSEEAAQALLEREAGEVTGAATKAEGKLHDQVQGWVREIEADKDFGGARLDVSKLNAERALTSFWPGDFVSQLKDSGLLYQPEFFRGLARLGAALGEGGSLESGSPTGGQGSAEARLRAMYPNSQEMFGDTPTEE
jgi:hypothetical protein